MASGAGDISDAGGYLGVPHAEGAAPPHDQQQDDLDKRFPRQGPRIGLRPRDHLHSGKDEDIIAKGHDWSVKKRVITFPFREIAYIFGGSNAFRRATFKLRGLDQDGNPLSENNPLRDHRGQPILDADQNPVGYSRSGKIGAAVRVGLGIVGWVAFAGVLVTNPLFGVPMLMLMAGRVIPQMFHAAGQRRYERMSPVTRRQLEEAQAKQKELDGQEQAGVGDIEKGDPPLVQADLRAARNLYKAAQDNVAEPEKSGAKTSERHRSEPRRTGKSGPAKESYGREEFEVKGRRAPATPRPGKESAGPLADAARRIAEGRGRAGRGGMGGPS